MSGWVLIILAGGLGSFMSAMGALLCQPLESPSAPATSNATKQTRQPFRPPSLPRLILGAAILLVLHAWICQLSISLAQGALVAFSAIGWIWLACHRNECLPWIKSFRRGSENPWMFLLPFLGFFLGASVCSLDGWDERVYHGELPRRWLSDDRVARYPDLPYSYFPNYLEIFVCSLNGLCKFETGRLVALLGWGAMHWQLFRLVRACLSPLVSAIVCCSFICTSVSVLTAQNFYIEQFKVLFMLAILEFWIFNRREKKTSLSNFCFALSVGVLCGAMSAVKLTGVPVAIFFLLAVCSMDLIENRALSWKVHGVMFFVWFVITLVAYLPAWLTIGNPTFPYFAAFWNGSESLRDVGEFHHAMGDAFGFRNAMGFLITPILMPLFEGLYDGSFGWQLCLWVLLLVYSFVNRTKLIAEYWIVAVTGLFSYSFWFATSQQARFGMGWAVCLCLLVAYQLGQWTILQRRFACALMIVASSVSLPWAAVGFNVEGWARVLGAELNDYAWVDAAEQSYRACVKKLNESEEVQNVLLVCEQRGYDLSKPHRVGTPYFQSQFTMPSRDFVRSEAWVKQLSEGSFTHVWIAKSLRGPDRPSDFLDRISEVYIGIEALTKEEQLRVIYEDDYYWIMQFRRAASLER